MTVSKAQQKATAKYISANYEQIKVFVKKGKREAIRQHATRRGESVNAFINRAIDLQMQTDSAIDIIHPEAEQVPPPRSSE